MNRSLPHLELMFRRLHGPGPSLSFDCDEDGHVALDTMSEQQQANYYYARTLVGRDYAMPEVVRRHALTEERLARLLRRVSRLDRAMTTGR